MFAFKVSDTDQGAAGIITNVRLDNDADAWFALRSDDDNGQYIVEVREVFCAPRKLLL